MDFDKYKSLLLAEKARLEKELNIIGYKDPNHPGEWEIKAPDMNTMTSDQSELADMFEELESQTGLEVQLEDRYKHIVSALDRIENGKYGVCVVCNKPIEENRLEANPVAQTCIEHKEKQV